MKQAGEVVNASACRSYFGSLADPSAAKKAVMDVVYKLIKQDPTADIATELQKLRMTSTAGCKVTPARCHSDTHSAARGSGSE